MSRFRHEYKYTIDSFQKVILHTRAEGLLLRDPHVENNGSYIIRSLYFDDCYDSCFFENENGTDPRSKFRIRYYNNDSSFLNLEKKSKCRGMTLKESCKLTISEYDNICKGEYSLIDCGKDEAKKKLITEMQLRGLVPKVIVTYIRTPFVYGAGNVRITFDDDISSSNEIEKFIGGDYSERLILPLGTGILEVKWDDILPLHLKEAFQLGTLQRDTFSKYYSCRMIYK